MTRNPFENVLLKEEERKEVDEEKVFRRTLDSLKKEGSPLAEPLEILEPEEKNELGQALNKAGIPWTHFEKLEEDVSQKATEHLTGWLANRGTETGQKELDSLMSIL